ncbi:metallophosphoesterase [Desulfosporosinus fructosivorans]|uniref:Metallophosphoesterase n=1 Tax=Desulfosporosinus fructosivorans TaxID=2018669 RepID=A0A4Z0QZD4_9FIRM|nr:metallophosphoesterase [Desulfosporosinus fructosivorans]TGE36152.1 metallophosphoesterase [Desulfosporosinus fructosivorans]
MKKIRLLLFAVIVSGLLLFDHQLTIPESAVPLSQVPYSDLSFAVLGDIHSNNNSLKQAIRDLYSINPAMNALILNGDIVDQGIKRQYDAIKKTLYINRLLLPKIIIKNIGNHEFFNYNIEINGPEDVKLFINRYLEFAEKEKVYHDTWINGYHFISLGSEDGNSLTLDSIRAFISEAQKEWLKDKLAENYTLGKPMFVFLHQPLNSNPSSGWVGSDQSEEIRKILSQYPEIILFNSHTHADLTEKSVVLHQPYTKVHTGAVHYTIVQHAQGQNRTREALIKGLYIEVNGNIVVIKGRDLKERSWIFSTIIPIPGY